MIKESGVLQYVDKTIGQKKKKRCTMADEIGSLVGVVPALSGMLFPYMGLTSKALDLYIKEIEKSNMSTDAKLFCVLNAKKKIKQMKNQKAIAEIAMVNMEEGTNLSDTSDVRQDFLDRFMSSASYVSEPDMQLIWGKILAKEFENPGKTPPNMMRVLAEMTPVLAKSFRLVCSMQVSFIPLSDKLDSETILQKIFVPFHCNEETFSGLGLDFITLNELDSLGVIKFQPSNGFVIEGFESKEIKLVINSQEEITIESKNGVMPSGDVMLTSAGEALKKIIDTLEIDAFSKYVKQYVSDKGYKYV